MGLARDCWQGAGHVRTRVTRAVLGVAVFLALASAACAADEAEEVGTIILNMDSFWRVRTVWETREVALPSGEVQHAVVETPRNTYEYLQKNPDKNKAPSYTLRKVPLIRLPEETPADWAKLEFDDGAWARLRGPVLANSTNENWKTILLRGMFEVRDNARAGEMSVSLWFRGGAVVYINGEEVARAFMPEGDIDIYTPALPYSDDAYLTTDGFILFPKDKSDDAKPRLAQRTRTALSLKIPKAKLRKGPNVLGVAIHRAPTNVCFFIHRGKGSFQCNPPHADSFWAKIGLMKIQLVAQPGAAVTPNIGLPEKRGFRAWNQSVVQRTVRSDFPDPFVSLGAMRMTGVRNGIFSAQVVIAHDEAIHGLKVEASDLKGPGVIPASAAEIRYARADGAAWGADQPPWFDSLEEVVPDEVPLTRDKVINALWLTTKEDKIPIYCEQAIQPIWLRVRVPADAKPGDYTGTLTISADEIKQPLVVQIALRVIDWTLPEPDKRFAWMDIAQSPESVAMAYDVPMWSDAHLKLLDKTFELLGELCTKTLYVTGVRRTHFGNEHALVRWVRDAEGDLQPDLSVVEKYLDVATKRLGKVPGVILYCWEPPESQGHAGGAGTAARTYDRPALITTWDPKTGKLGARVGPSWGTPEAPLFWKRLTDALSESLKKRGMDGSLIFGLAGDTRPTKQAMDDICFGMQDAKWAIHSHYYCDKWQGYKMGMTTALWGIGCSPTEPERGYCMGWSNPHWLSYFPREMSHQSTLVEHRTKLENWMGAKPPYTKFVAKRTGVRSLGRIGADFWTVVRDGRGRLVANLVGRYPETAWGQLNLNNGIVYLLAPGKKGPIATVRSESFREGLQELEARIYLERALLDDKARELLGDDLIARCRKTLDDRIRMCLNAGGEGQPWFISSGWNERAETLFSLAAEVSKKFGGREPEPNLADDPDPKKK